MDDATFERAAELRAEITRISLTVDRFRGNPDGTCERACYFWYHAPDMSYLTDIDVLEKLRDDAMNWLRDSVNQSNVPSTYGAA
jgi:hypothetical protein